MTTSDWLVLCVGLLVVLDVRVRVWRPKYTARPHPMVFRPDDDTWTFSDTQGANEDDYTYAERQGDPVTVVIADVYTYESPGPGDIIHRDNMKRYVVLRRVASLYGERKLPYTLLLSEKSMENP